MENNSYIVCVGVYILLYYLPPLHHVWPPQDEFIRKVHFLHKYTI